MPDKCLTYHARFYCYQAIFHSATITHSDPKKLTYIPLLFSNSDYSRGREWEMKVEVLSVTNLRCFVGGDLESPWCRCDSPESCSSWLICVLVCVCVCELSGCCAAVLLLWLVDTALTSLPRGCTSVDWDVCRTAVLELLSDFSLKQVKSPPLTPTASSSLSLSSRCLSPSSSTCACLSSLLPRAGIF